MILRCLKSRRGFSLVELLLFSAIFAFVSVAFVGIFVVITKIQSRESSTINVNQESQFLLQKMRSLIQESSLIEMSVDVSTTTIKLRVFASSSDPTYIYASGSLIFSKVTDIGIPEPLVTDKVAISSTSFVKRSNPGGHDAVDISFTMKANSSSSAKDYSQTINASIARVGAAVFNSDIRPSSSQIRIGVNYDDILEIGRSLAFSNGNVAIGSADFRPTERLEIQGGGLKFANTSTRPVCDSSTRGTLWFNATTSIKGDSLSMCFMSIGGTPYWAEGGTSNIVTSTVNNSGNTGFDNSVTVARNDPDYVYASFYNSTAGADDLNFTSTTQAGVWPMPAGMVVDSSSADVGQYTSITAPTTSTIYISYYDASNNDLKFASSTNGGSTWSYKAVATTSDQGQYTSITAPTTSTIYISYFRPTGDDLLVARSQNGGGSWTLVDVDVGTAGSVGKYTSIAAPTVSTVYLCYYDATNDDLDFAYSTSSGVAGSWTTSTLDSAITGGISCSISAPSTSTIFISYYNRTPAYDIGSLKFVRSLTGPEGFESPQYIDPDTYEGKWSAITSIDGKRVFAAYHSYKGSSHSLRRAFSELSGELGSWATTTIVAPTGYEVGKEVSVAAIDKETYVALYKQLPGSDSALSAIREIVGSPIFY
jgi:type II secretory pathway pseudopilin PulG